MDTSDDRPKRMISQQLFAPSQEFQTKKLHGGNQGFA
jgi:hypothetical protein